LAASTIDKLILDRLSGLTCDPNCLNTSILIQDLLNRTRVKVSPCHKVIIEYFDLHFKFGPTNLRRLFSLERNSILGVRSHTLGYYSRRIVVPPLVEVGTNNVVPLWPYTNSIDANKAVLDSLNFIIPNSNVVSFLSTCHGQIPILFINEPHTCPIINIFIISCDASHCTRTIMPSIKEVVHKWLAEPKQINYTELCNGISEVLYDTKFSKNDAHLLLEDVFNTPNILNRYPKAFIQLASFVSRLPSRQN